jgi:hypothetical protein
MTSEIQDLLGFNNERRYGRAVEKEFTPSEYLALCARQKAGDVQVVTVWVDRAKYTVLYREELKPGEMFPVEPSTDCPPDDFPTD